MAVYDKRYLKWTMERVLKRIFSYLILFPVLVALYPVTAVCNWLGKIFYNWK